MPTPEEEQQFMQWMSTVNPQAMFSGQNIQGAAAAVPPSQEQQFLDWSRGIDPAQMFSGQNMRAAETTAINDARAARMDQQQREDQSLTPEERAAQAQNDRYGSDLSWLDPSFQYNPSMLGQSAGSTAAADPNAINAQNAAMQQAQQMANTNLQFQSPAQQQALAQQWAQVQGGQGAPQFMGGGQQQQLMNQLLGVQAPQFSGDADQRSVLNQALGMSSNTGPGSLAFDTSGRQGEQYGNLQGIIAGGGATAIEMADRARQRGDSEAWLRGQREADMADYAERGLTGSGMELLSLSSDRQAAAGRNSLADLETAKALEERRLGAINSAAGLATNMRGQTVDEQSLLNNRATSGLNAASSVANSMRGANIEEQLGLNQAARGQITSAADIANQSRTQGYNELTYNDTRMRDALGQQTTLANTMRDQTADEQVANRNALQSSLDTFANTSNNARQSSAQESQYRAGAADDFSVLNQSAANNAAQNNTQFLQTSYQQMMNNRQQWEMNNLNQQIGVAEQREAGDRADNNTGWTQGTNLGTSDAAAWNALSQEQRNAFISNFQGGQANQAAASQAGNAANGQIAGGLAGTAGMAGQMVASAYTGGAAGAGAAAGSAGASAAPSTNLSMPTGGGGTNNYGVGVGGSSQPANYGVSVLGLNNKPPAANANSGVAGNFDWEKLRQTAR